MNSIPSLPPSSSSLIEPPRASSFLPCHQPLWSPATKSNLNGSLLRDWCKTRADKSPPDRSTGSKIRRGDRNRISFNPVHKQPRNRRCSGQPCHNVRNRKAHSSWSTLLASLLFFFPLSVFFFFFSFSHIFIPRVSTCHCAPFQTAAFLIKSASPLHRWKRSWGETRNRGDTCWASNGNSDYQSVAGSCGTRRILFRSYFFRNLK